MNIRTSMRDGGGPSLVGGIVFAVFVAVNAAAGPDALESSFARATAAGRSAVASVVRRAADLALRYGGEEGVGGSDPVETCPPRARSRGRGSMKTRTCEIRVRCARSRDGAAILGWPSAGPWICRSPS
jgi:hypothetical protein